MDNSQETNCEEGNSTALQSPDSSDNSGPRELTPEEVSHICYSLNVSG